MVNAIKGGGALPDIPDLTAELLETTYTFQGDALILEPKKNIKARLGRSPDLSDSLALTFAGEVAPRQSAEAMRHMTVAAPAYNPFKAYL